MPPVELLFRSRFGKHWSLKHCQPLEIRPGDGGLEIEIAPIPMRLKIRGKGVIAISDSELPVLGVEQVCDTLEKIRR
jgi:hypothetical protein